MRSMATPQSHLSLAEYRYAWVGVMLDIDNDRPPVRLLSVSKSFPKLKGRRALVAMAAMIVVIAPYSRHPCQSRVSDVVGF